MICKHCKTDNAPIKKTCANCGKILSGPNVNNVTGKYGIRHDDGSFTPFKSGQRFYVDFDGMTQFFLNENGKPMYKLTADGYSAITEFDCFPIPK